MKCVIFSYRGLQDLRFLSGYEEKRRAVRLEAEMSK
jgi:hypothetical protein